MFAIVYTIKPYSHNQPYHINGLTSNKLFEAFSLSELAVYEWINLKLKVWWYIKDLR